MTTGADDSVRYLTRAEVVAVSRDLDVVDVITRALILHARGATVLPGEAYLPWHTADGSFARSLALPAAVRAERWAIGLKVINSCLGNPARGIPRAQGLTLVFDPDRAHPVAILEAAYLSALRTAAYTVLSCRTLAVPEPERIAVIGCGALGEEHVRLLAGEYPAASFALYDKCPEAARALRDRVAAVGAAMTVADSAEAAVRAASVVVTTTTTTVGYLPYGWLSPGALVAHVSLDDVEQEVVQRADLVVVDDWELIRADDRRLLGRMYRSGLLIGPADPPGRATDGRPPVRRVDGSLGDILVGRHLGRSAPEQIVLSNPFGMGVLDVLLAEEIYQRAAAVDAGTLLPR